MDEGPDEPGDVVSDEMIQMVLDEASSSMSDAVTHVRREFSAVRTGRASSAIVEKITVVADGVETVCYTHLTLPTICSV